MGNAQLNANNSICFFGGSPYGTASGASNWIGQVQEHTPDESESLIPTRYITGGDRNVDTFLVGPGVYTGTVRYFLQDAKLLTFGMGSVATGSAETGYTHTISELSPTGCYPYFTIEDHQESIANEDLMRTYHGCAVDSFTVSHAEGNPVECEVNYIAQKLTSSSGGATAVSASTAAPFMWDDGRTMISGASVLDGKLAEVKTAGITVSQNLTGPNYSDGTRYIAKPILGNLDYEFTVTLGMTPGTGGDLHDAFKNYRSVNMDQFYERTSGTDYVQFAMSGCKIMDCENPSAIEGGIEQSLTIQPTSMTVIAHGSGTAGVETYPIPSTC